MQHTLLPPKERKWLRHEYHVRAWIVALFAFSVAGTIGVASLFPAFMRGTLEERFQLQAVARLEQNKNASGAAEVEKQLASDRALLVNLSTYTDRKFLSAEIEHIASLKGNNLLSSLSIESNEEGASRLVVQGLSPTRESLLSFKTRIENQKPGTTVSLPISQLARSANIQFSLEILIPKP